MQAPKRAQKRRQERFKALTLPHLDVLLGIARRRLNDTPLAEDLVQDTYMRAWEAFDSLDDEAQVRGWLVRILQRVTNDHYRTQLRRQTLLPVTRLEDEHSDILASHEEGPLEALISRCSDERVEHALMQLPREFMEALELHDIEGFKYREVAEIMEIPLGTVMSRIARGPALARGIDIKGSVRLGSGFDAGCTHTCKAEFGTMTQLIDDTEERHQALIEQLAAYVDEELSAEERAKMQAHLVGCTRCRREIALQRALRARLDGQPSTRASAALRERIALALDTATERPSDSVSQGFVANIVQGLRGVFERLTPRPARPVLPWLGWAFAVPLAVALVLVTRPESEGDRVPTGGVSAQLPVIVAASDLKFALEEVAARFTVHTKRELKLVFGSSGNFAREIEQGAPFQMFLSADEGLVFKLAETGKTVDRGVLYALGRIVIMVPHGSPLKADPELRHLAAALSEGRITRFAIADPEHAPHGKRAEEALRHAGLWDRIKDHLVLGENVSQAAQLVTAGGAQGGIIAYSLALSPSVSKLGRYALIPDAWHQPLKQRMVLIKGANETTQAFYRYLQQPAARDILRRYGLALPGEQ